MTEFFFFLSLGNILLYIYIPHLLYPFLCRWTSRLLLCPIINSAAVNIGVYVSCWVMVFLGNMPSSGISGSYGTSMFIFSRNLHTVLHSGCINLHFHQLCKRIPFSLHPPQCLLVVCLILSEVWVLFIILSLFCCSAFISINLSSSLLTHSSASVILLIPFYFQTHYLKIINVYVPIAVFVIVLSSFLWTFSFFCDSWLEKFL